ncbi:MAG: polysaccharide biosynthesis protein [Bacteroidota bacterium]
MQSEIYEQKTKYMNKFTRGIFLFVGDVLALLLSAIVVFWILSSLGIAEKPFPVIHTAIIIGSVVIGLMLFRMYMVNWRYTSLNDLGRIILGVTVGGGLSLATCQFFMEMGSYEATFATLVLTNGVLTIGGFRISKRMYYRLIKSQNGKNQHTIIFGGENEGEQILRDILTNDHWNLSVYGIFDDRVTRGLLLHGVRILGGKNEMIEYIKNNPVDQLIVAFPEYPKKDLKIIIDEVKSIRPDMDIKVLPSFHSLTDNPVGVEHIREVSIEDILGRKPVKIDLQTIKASITDKTVLITGAGGSIGSELVRQCANLNPGKLIALDIDETELFHIENEFKKSGILLTPCVASVTDEQKMNKILARYKPDIIFHAAAYKHVPMMESFPGEAIKVNIGGTRLLASLACKHEVDKFIMVSTDKAVNPANVMGATKRVAEEVCMAYNGTCITKFISVRFGNVLGSRGSVVPLFIEQIKNGGPVTITDPEMQRYFMTIPEAVLLVMQAGSMGTGGEVFVLDMGEPVKIMDMAKDLIRLHGLEPYRDIQIKITGLRPGEKLFEELLNAEEGVIKTEHEEIFKAVCSTKMPPSVLESRINQLFALLEDEESNSVRALLKTIVPTYSYGDAKKKKVPERVRATDESLLIG